MKIPGFLKILKMTDTMQIHLPSDSSDFVGWLAAIISVFAAFSIVGLFLGFSVFNDDRELSLFVESIRSRTSAWTGFWRCMQSAKYIKISGKSYLNPLHLLGHRFQRRLEPTIQLKIVELAPWLKIFWAAT
jgi:hypothetical protein